MAYNRKKDQNWIAELKKGDHVYVAIAYNPKHNDEFDIVDIDGTIEKNVVYLAEALDSDPYRHHPYDVVDVSVDGSREKTIKAVVLGTIDESFMELVYAFDIADDITLDKYRFHGEFIVSNQDADKRDADGEGQGQGQGRGMKAIDGKDISDMDVDGQEASDFAEGNDDKDDKDQKGQGQGQKGNDKDKKDQEGQGGQNDGKDEKDGQQKGSGGQGKKEGEKDKCSGDEPKDAEGSGAHGKEDVPEFDTPSRRRVIKTKLKVF